MSDDEPDVAAEWTCAICQDVLLAPVVEPLRSLPGTRERHKCVSVEASRPFGPADLRDARSIEARLLRHVDGA